MRIKDEYIDVFVTNLINGEIVRFGNLNKEEYPVYYRWYSSYFILEDCDLNHQEEVSDFVIDVTKEERPSDEVVLGVDDGGNGGGN